MQLIAPGSHNDRHVLDVREGRCSLTYVDWVGTRTIVMSSKGESFAAGLVLVATALQAHETQLAALRLAEHQKWHPLVASPVSRRGARRDKTPKAERESS